MSQVQALRSELIELRKSPQRQLLEAEQPQPLQEARQSLDIQVQVGVCLISPS